MLSIFAPYLAESRALMVWYQGELHFPTFRYIEMSRFGQAPPPAWSTSEIEVEYLRLQREWEAERFMHGRDRAAAVAAGADAAALAAIDAKYPNRDHCVVMPPIPWDPYQNDFWANEILQEIQRGACRRADARRPNGWPAATGCTNWPTPSTTAVWRRCWPTRRSRPPARWWAWRAAAPCLRSPTWARRRRMHQTARAVTIWAPTRRAATSRRGCSTAFASRSSSRSSWCSRARCIGTVIGSLQGYLGGRFDIISQRLIEVLIAIPFLYVVIIMAALFQPSFWMLLGIIAIFQWIGITFFMRTEMYREKTREYCLAAKSYGASHLRIVFRHLLPNCLTPLVTFTPFAVVGAIFALTGLDYLGYGLPAPTPSWGELIDQALQVENRNKLWLTLAPVRRADGHAGAGGVHRRVGARGLRSRSSTPVMSDAGWRRCR